MKMEQNRTATAMPSDDYKPCVMWHIDSYPQSQEAILTGDGFVLVSCAEKVKEEDGNIIEPVKIFCEMYLYAPIKGAFIFSMDMDKNLMPFSIEGKWGYCDIETGKVVVEPQWDYCDEFHGDYAKFCVDGEFDEETMRYYGGMVGIVDYHGNIVIEPKYESLGRIRDGLTARKDGLWGVIDLKETTIIPFHYEALRCVHGKHDGFFMAHKDGLWGVIDRNEQLIVPFQHEWIKGYGYEIGFAAGTLIDGKELVTIYDENGRLIIDKLTTLPKRYRRSGAEQRKMRHFSESTCQLIRRGRKFGVICDLEYDLNPAHFVSFFELDFDKIKNRNIEVVAEPSLSHKDAVALIRKIDDDAMLKDKAFSLAAAALMYSGRSVPCPDGDTLWDNFPEEKQAAVLALIAEHGLPLPETVRRHHHPSGK